MKINKNTDALLVVDAQNSFITGSLAVPGAEEIIPIIVELESKFDTIIYSRDAHIKKHPSFKAQGGPWPEHCVINSFGHLIHKDLMLCTGVPIVIIDKGLEEEAYSAFSGNIVAGPDIEVVEELLKTFGTKRLFVCGLATDYCVKATVLDALKLFDGEVYVLHDAIRDVNIKEGDGIRAIEEMGHAGAIFINSSDLED
jgi:nicotinamidase/pyrazinamidase